ncbi:MAG: hypothetical protein HY859_00345 [Caulobacterales bacterium]|nr:hypothetical protein [Caulobacterales bacterium]
MMLKTFPFDPADYLDSEEGIAAYLADARTDGPEALSDAIEVIARARTRMKLPVTDAGSASASKAAEQDPKRG